MTPARVIYDGVAYTVGTSSQAEGRDVVDEKVQEALSEGFAWLTVCNDAGSADLLITEGVALTVR